MLESSGLAGASNTPPDLTTDAVGGQSMAEAHAIRKPRPRKSLADRFWPKVKVGKPDECWQWQAALNGVGYGAMRISVEKGRLLTHRFSYELHFGPIPKGMFVCHKCDNRACVNPSHLFLGTNRENMDDKIRKGRQLRGSQVPTSKLTEDDVREIRRLRSEGVTCRVISQRVGVTQGHISDIATGRRWRHL